MGSNFDMDEMIHVMTAISNYKKLLYTLSGFRARKKGEKYYNEQIPSVVEYCDRYIKTVTTTSQFYWDMPDIHVVSQQWGSTSAGWGGIGGSAMTTSYTTVIVNSYHKIVAVYYNGTLAYLVEIDDEIQKYAEKGYTNIPPYSSIESTKLKLIYKNPRD